MTATGTHRWYTARLVRAVRLTATARSLTFLTPGWQGSDAGQHVDVRLTAPDGYQAVRSYSLADVGRGEEVEIAVERLADGEVSPFLVDDLGIGDSVELRGPLGGWFVWRPEMTVPVQLIAGGSGVVPLVAMTRAHARADSTTPMRLLYSLRAPDDALFRDELSAPGATTQTTWHYTRQVPPGWPRLPGRVTARDLERETLPPEAGLRTYVCGPTGFVESVARALIGLGHEPESIRTERFGGA